MISILIFLLMVRLIFLLFRMALKNVYVIYVCLVILLSYQNIFLKNLLSIYFLILNIFSIVRNMLLFHYYDDLLIYIFMYSQYRCLTFLVIVIFLVILVFYDTQLLNLKDSNCLNIFSTIYVVSLLILLFFCLGPLLRSFG